MSRSRADLGTRLRRALLMIPWLLEEGGSTVAQIAARFDMEESEVVRDLTLVMCCGLPPYGGGDLITIVIDDDGTVEAWPGPFFTRPMRLTPAEGFAVLAAGRALEAVPGSAQREALSSALEKLENALGASGAIAVDLESPALLDTVQRAASDGQQLRVTYYTAGRDEVSERVIEPLLVHTRDGRWYAETRDVSDPANPLERRLRVDRIRSAAPTGVSFAPPSPSPTPPARVFTPGPDATDVVLTVPATERWVVAAYDFDEPEVLRDGRLRLRFSIEGETFLERLLLRIGPGAVVESPPELTGLAAAAARRILARYR